MKLIDVIRKLHALDRMGFYVFTKRDIEKMFPEESGKTLEKSLQRLVAEGVLERVSKGIYLNAFAHSRNGYVIETIAILLRRGFHSYVSLESALSEYGVISQIPSRITIMTTGSGGCYETPYGVIEFSHTSRSISDIASNTLVIKGRPLRIAAMETALADLKGVGRNMDMLPQELNAQGVGYEC